MNYQETSREAFADFAPVYKTLDDQILASLTAEGITCNAIEHLIGRSHQAVSGNLRHLVEKGKVKHNGKYGVTDSGRKAMLWAAA